MDDIGQIVYETIRISTPEFIRLVFAGMAGGLLGAYVNDKLTKKRETQSGIVSRRREFLSFMRLWRIELENSFANAHIRIEGPDAFTETVSAFSSAAEMIRRDFSGNQRNKFEGLILAVTDCRNKHWDTHKERHQQLLNAVDGITAFVDSATI